jgi:16S rRNA processing protein RimM
VDRVHGLAGEVGVRLFDPGSEALDVVERVLVRLEGGEERVLEIESVRDTPKDLLVCFEEISDRTAAESLKGGQVFVFREDMEAPKDGEYFQGDLVGLSAFDEQGNELGKVEEIWETGPVPNLVIRGPARLELVVPFADEFVPAVDVEGGRIVVRPPKIEE